jgi:hypothetical protein
MSTLTGSFDTVGAFRTMYRRQAIVRSARLFHRQERGWEEAALADQVHADREAQD